MAKLWAGRFSKETDDGVNAFNSSISFDSRMFREDIKGSQAHVCMLGEAGIIEKKDANTLKEGLEQILCDIESGNLDFDYTAEDIHMFIEAELIKQFGDTGKKLHTARSRNDQVALDIRLYLKNETDVISGLLKSLIGVICTTAENNTETVMPGYTHLQRAQPITFAHHLMAYAEMLMRDLGRLSDAKARMDESPLGSCALAGTTYPIDRDKTAHSLGFSRPTANSLDGVSDRDFCIELLNAFSIIMVHLSRFSEEIILWCSHEFKFIELDDAFATGSSIMPQKKNPDVAELVRGKAARIFGNNLTLLTMMKGLPLAYNKDMQEDKEAVFDALDNVKLCIETFTPMLSTMTVLGDNMRKAAAHGFINATDCADYLVKKGMAFRDAYAITGRIVALCIEKNTTLEELDLNEYNKYSELFGEDIYSAVNLENCVNGRKSYGGPAPVRVKEHIANVKQRLSL